MKKLELLCAEVYTVLICGAFVGILLYGVDLYAPPSLNDLVRYVALGEAITLPVVAVGMIIVWLVKQARTVQKRSPPASSE